MLGLFSLAILALRPLVSSTETGEHLAILTPGYENAHLDSLKKVHRNIRVIPYRPNEPLFSKAPRSSVYILGNGLEPYDLWQMDSVRALHMPGKLPKGVIRFSYEPGTTVGERAVFRGRYANMKKGQKLVLEGAGGVGMDSVVIDIPKKGDFQLSLEPKVAGNFLFYLAIKDSVGGVVNIDPIPVWVTEKEALDIFIVNGFPTFETKYLKNYLAESGHKVTVRSQLTRGRFKYEFFNRERSIIGNLSQKMLEEHDLLIMDANSFRNLTSAERSSILKAVRENGLGLFVQPDDAFFYDPTNTTPFRFLPDGNTVMSLPKRPKMELEKFPYTFKGVELLRPIHKMGETVLSAYYNIGAGRIGTTVLGATYGLMLQGKGDGYQLLWADIVSEMAKRKREMARWESPRPWAYRDRPFTFGLWTSIPVPKVSTHEGVPIPMRQDIDLEQLWTGTHYPRETGWHVQSVEQDTLHPFHYYVLDRAWESMEMYNTLTQNQRHFQGSIMKDGQRAGVRPLSPLWPFLVFLGCMAFLWLEPKLLGP
mgnify:CR=1 FL=1